MPRNFNRLVLLLGAALLAGVPALHAQQTGAPVRGDVDGDGRVTAADARIVSDYLVGKPVPAGANVRERGDVNGDGRVTAVDAAIIARAAAGRDMSRFPVGKAPTDALAVVECTGDVRTASVDCHAPGASAGGARGNIAIVYGGQNQNVKVTSDNVALVADTFQFTVTIQNLLKQAVGADSGNANPDTVRLFFANGIGVDAGSMAVANADGMNTYTASNQRYFQYSGMDLGADGILSPGEISQAKTWKLHYTGSPHFTFTLFVATRMPYPQGWVNITPPGGHPNRGPDSVFTDTVIAGRTLGLTGLVRNAFNGDSVYNDTGVKVANPPVKWFSTGYGNVTVDSLTGLVKATKMASGVDSITAVSGQLLVRRGRLAIVVVPPSGPHSVMTATSPVQAGDSTLVKVQVYDALNRPVTSGGDSVTLSVTGLSGATLRGTGAAGTTSIIAVDSLNGVYTAWLKSTATGTANLTGKVETQPIGTTTSVTFNAATPALIEKVQPLTLDTINPGPVSTAPKVRVKDAFGNLVPGATVTFAASTGSSVGATNQPSENQVTANPSGEATVSKWTIGEGLDSLTVSATTGSALPVVFTAYGNKAPIAVRDSIDAIGNVTVTATGLKGNDTDPENETLTITDSTLTTGGGGTVTITAAGGVTYTPLIGFTGLDSVNYKLNDPRGRSAIGKLMMRVSGRYWFVQTGGSGNGTMASPSGNFTFGAALAAKDSIFLLGTVTVASGVTLPNGGALIGRGIASNISRSLGGSVNMTVNPVTLLTTGASPTLTVSSGTGVTLTSAGTGYIVKGLSLVTSAGAGISGTNFGTLALSNNELSINATGGAALNLSTGALSGALGTLSSSGGTGLSLTSVTGSLSATGGTLNGSASGPAVNVSGGSVRLTYAGSLAQTANAALVSVSGGHTDSLTFNTGTVTASNGSGLQFDNADGTYSFNNGVSLVNGAGGDAGIDVLNNSGGTFTFPASSQITGPANEAIRINASAPTFSYLGRIDKTNGSTGITATNNTGGTISFGSHLKKITSTGGNVAVNLATNGTATITSLDSLQITSATGNGYNATGGGTVEVQGAQNTISSSGGIALNVSSTTISANGLTFRSISASGGSNGISLSGTGSSGGLTVTGDGSTNGSGGSITNTTGADGATSGNGVYLSSARKISLSWMAFSGHTNNGIFGTGVRGGFTLDHVRFTGTNGNSSSGSFDESPVHLVDAGGPIKMTNSRFDGGAYNAVLVENISGTAPAIDSLVIATDTVTSMQGSTSDVRSTALLVNLMDGTADIRIRNNFVTAWWGNGIHVLSQGAATATARITNNTVDNQNGALAGAGGIWVGGGNLAYNISNNVVKHTNGTAISAGRSNNPAGANMNGTIDSNTIGVSGDTNSGSATGIAIFAEHHGSGVSTVKISNNTIRQIAGSASGAITTNLGDDSGSGGSGTLNATVTGNNIAETGSPTNNAQQGMFFEAGAASGDNDAMCLDVGGATAALKNTITNFNTTAPATSQNRIRVNQRFVTTVKLPGYTGAGGDNTAVQTYILGRNTISNALAQNTSATYGNTSPAGSACPQPTM